jgi:hypothetical protein
MLQRTNKENSFEKYFSYSKPQKEDYNQKVLSLEDSNKAITQFIKTNEPFLISRLGSGELRCTCNYLHFKEKNKKTIWHHQIKYEMYNYGGIFPQNSKTLKIFSEIYIDAVQYIDAIGIWYNIGENKIIESYCPKAKLVPLISLEPYIHASPWSALLKGKKVLVIHPFTDTIKSQYNKRGVLFNNKNILPDFDLLTLKSAMSIPGETLPYKNWTEALDSMKTQINSIEFDIAIIGAGPYGLPLGAHVKNIGKQAIHLGGATQLLFGIKGRRWLERDYYQNLFNEHWVFPNISETPKNKMQLEGGCYWK